MNAFIDPNYFLVTRIALVLLGYLMGSIPTGYWICRSKGIDIRTIGSGSTGATNVLRAAGKTAAIATLIIDVLKGYLPVLLAILADEVVLHTPGPIAGKAPVAGPLTLVLMAQATYLQVVPVLVAIAALLGHSKSIFLNFTGGKSAATALGTLLAMNPVAAGITFAFWCLLVFLTRIVSIASMAAGVMSGVFFALFHSTGSYIVYCAIGAIYVIIRHIPNIKRLASGTEPRIGQKT